MCIKGVTYFFVTVFFCFSLLCLAQDKKRSSTKSAKNIDQKIMNNVVSDKKQKPISISQNNKKTKAKKANDSSKKAELDKKQEDIPKKEAATDAQKQARKNKPRVTVKNAITPEMTKYRFWGTYYEPTQLYLSIHDKKLQRNETVECTLNNSNCIEITYHYEFQNGIVTGSKCVEFEITNPDQPIEITFSWKDNHRLMSNHGRVVGSKKGIMKSSCSFI